MPFTDCYKCAGDAGKRVVVSCFLNSDHGHVYCMRCGITHDDNVDKVARIDLTSDAIKNISDDKKYRDVFVETSKVKGEDGDEYTDFNWESQKELKRAIVSPVIDVIDDHLKNKNSAFKLLDLGCASGFTSTIYADEFPGSSVFAVDPSAQVLAVDGYKQRVIAKQGTLQTVEVADNTLDVVVIIGNLMLHSNPLQTIELSLSKLKAGGILVFDVKNIKASARMISLWIARLGIRHSIPRSYYERNFLNMRFGFHQKYLLEYMKAKHDGVELVQKKSKSPRLLEARNKHEYSNGLIGFVWRFLNALDRVRGQQAWLQFTYKKMK